VGLDRVKNPAYPETLYVDGLIAPDTVNTMPMKTLLAVAERGTIVADTAREDAGPALAALADAGIDMDDVTATLLAQGIAAFVEPMNKLLAGIESAAPDGPHRAPAGDRRGDRRDLSAAIVADRVARPSSSASRGACGPRTSRCGAARACPRSATGSAG
jgi:hypothetical protein